VFSSFVGTANDNEGYVTKVEFSLQNLKTSKYYQSGGGWLSSQDWISVSTATLPDWSYSRPALTSNCTYQFVVRAWDSAGNMEITYSSITFTYDETGPSSEVTIPADGALLNNLTQIEGTSYDETAGVETVELYIHDFIQGRYWNGTQFVSTTTIQWVPADDTTWQYTGITQSDWIANGDTQYRIRCRAIDKVGNYGLLGATHTFTFDVTEPESRIINPTPDGVHLNALSSIDGTAFDATAGIDKIYLRIKRNSDGYTWAGSSFTAEDSWVLTTELTPDATKWTYTSLPAWVSGSSYTLNVRAIDFSTNWETDFTTMTFVWDTTGPETVITTPQKVSPFTPLYWLDQIIGTANDATGEVQKVEVKISRTRDGYYWNGSTWTATAVWFDLPLKMMSSMLLR